MVLILILSALLSGNGTSASASSLPSNFVHVVGDHFEVNGARYSYLGTNLWSAMNLGSTGAGGDRARLIRELDRLQNLGIKNLRIVAASEGPGTEPGRIIPALQETPGVFDSNLLKGLDFALAEMGKRGMCAILVLNNFWAWSGGMSQYVSWSTGEKIPYPSPFGDHSWIDFIAFSSRFYSDPKAVDLAQNTVQQIVNRTNSITGKPYREDPAIMAWELGNEPRGVTNTDDFNVWIKNSAHFIKTLDPNHLVTTGTEGTMGLAGIDIEQNNSSSDIDYATTHIWAQNFGWYNPSFPSLTYPVAVKMMKSYLDTQVEASLNIKKPLVLEEFGFSRDSNSYDPSSTTQYRDQFYTTILGEALGRAQAHQAICGVNFWAWAGEARPTSSADSLWKVGDPFLGDPPHEPQGWYSIYDSDTSTLSIIQNYVKLFSQLK